MANSKRRHQLRYASIGVLAILAIYLMLILTRPLKPINAQSLPNPVPVTGKLSVSWPSSSEAAIGVLGLGTLAENGEQTPTPTASIAKIVTALTVLNKSPLSLSQQGPTITLTSNDVADYNKYVAEDGSVIKVVAGEQISEYQALQAMLLPSANNMADTLALWAYGSMANYVMHANQLTKSLGMASTTIADASGFSPSTVSTATDLIRLGEAALSSPIVAQIVSQPSADLPVAGKVVNVDWFVGQYDLIGIKTGNTDQAGGCFLSAAKYDLGGGNYITVIGAVMKSPSLQIALDSTIPMLQSVKSQLGLKTIPAGTSVVSYRLPWGSSVHGVTKSSLVIPYVPGESITYINNASGTLPPLPIGSSVGNAEFSIGDTSSTANLVLNQPIPKPSAMWKLFHPQYFI